MNQEHRWMTAFILAMMILAFTTIIHWKSFTFIQFWSSSFQSQEGAVHCNKFKRWQQASVTAIQISCCLWWRRRYRSAGSTRGGGGGDAKTDQTPLLMPSAVTPPPIGQQLKRRKLSLKFRKSGLSSPSRDKEGQKSGVFVNLLYRWIPYLYLMLYCKLKVCKKTKNGQFTEHIPPWT